MTATPPQLERRQDPQLREVFEGAYQLIEPLIDPTNSWHGKTLEFLAFHVVREHYPQVGTEKIHLFLSVAKRTFHERSARPRQ